MKTIILEELGSGIDGIRKSFGDFMTDCAGFSFMEHNHMSGIQLTVKTNLKKEVFKVLWNVTMDNDLEKSMNDKDRAIEFGAMGLAILFTLELTDYDSFEVSRKGSGVDFWLFNENGGDLDFGKGARLEVSGIGKASRTNTLRSRVNIKKKQSEKSSKSGKIAYISVSEFSKPESAYLTA